MAKDKHLVCNRAGIQACICVAFQPLPFVYALFLLFGGDGAALCIYYSEHGFFFFSLVVMHRLGCPEASGILVP